MKKLSHETKLLLGAFTGTFALVMALGLRQPSGIAGGESSAAPRPVFPPQATAAPAAVPVPVPSQQTSLVPRRTEATNTPPPPAVPAPPLVEPPPGNEDYAPQNNY